MKISFHHPIILLILATIVIVQGLPSQLYQRSPRKKNGLRASNKGTRPCSKGKNNQASVTPGAVPPGQTPGIDGVFMTKDDIAKVVAAIMVAMSNAKPPGREIPNLTTPPLALAPTPSLPPPTQPVIPTPSQPSPPTPSVPVVTTPTPPPSSDPNKSSPGPAIPTEYGGRTSSGTTPPKSSSGTINLNPIPGSAALAPEKKADNPRPPTPTGLSATPSVPGVGPLNIDPASLYPIVASHSNANQSMSLSLLFFTLSLGILVTC